MRFPGDSPVTEGKKQALRDRIARLEINLSEVEEKFIRAGGPGGQKVNGPPPSMEGAADVAGRSSISVLTERAKSSPRL